MLGKWGVCYLFQVLSAILFTTLTLPIAFLQE